MSDLIVSYSLAQGNAKGLAVRLRDPGGQPHHERLQALNTAAMAWAQNNVRISTALSSGPKPEHPLAELSDYLYSDGQINSARFQRHLTQLHDQGKIHHYQVRSGLIEGRDLFGRERELEQLLSKLSTQSVHLRAPRRYGKTSLLLATQALLSQQERPHSYVDLAGGDTAHWVVTQTLAAALSEERLRARLQGSLDELRSLPLDGEELDLLHVKEHLAQTLTESTLPSFTRRLLGALRDAGAVLLLDEFSVYLRDAIREHNRDDALALLAQLQQARQQGLRVVLCGSAGLSSYIHFEKLDALFSDLIPLDLPPLAPEEGRIWAEELLYGNHLQPSPAVIDAIDATVGEPVPYFVSMLIDAIHAEVHGSPPTPAAVQRAYKRRLLGQLGNHVFRLYQLRSQPYPAELRPLAARLLRLLACTPDGVERALLDAEADRPIDALLTCLEEDYDLIREGTRWKMRSKVLRDRWALREGWLTEG